MKKLTTKNFIDRALIVHQNKYDYSKVIYIGNREKVFIIDENGFEHKQLPKDHLNGNRLTIQNATNKNDYFEYQASLIHGGRYDYSKINYINNKVKIKIICSEHGIFEQTPNHHLQGDGCPTCRQSKGEKEISEYLIENNINFTPQHTFNDCKNISYLPFDFYLPDLNTCIEYNGVQHYQMNNHFGGKDGFIKQQKNDKIKILYCKKNNIPLLIIKYNQNIINCLNDLLLIRP